MKKFLILFFGILIFLNLVSALEINIDVEDSFVAGEEISFDYSLLSDEDVSIEYVVSVSCPTAPLPLLEIKNLDLEAGISFEDNYVFMSSLSEETEPQTCSAYVSVLSPEEISNSKDFFIDTDPSFYFDVFTYSDEECGTKADVFYLGEGVYFDSDSEIEDFIFEGALIFPDGTEQEFSLEDFFILEKVGTYEIDFSVSKEGYKTVTGEKDFYVFKEELDLGQDSQETISEIEENESTSTRKVNELEIFIENNFNVVGAFQKQNNVLFIILVCVLIAILILFIVLVVVPMIKSAKN